MTLKTWDNYDIIDLGLKIALARAENDYGVKLYLAPELRAKWGRNPNIGAGQTEDVWNTGGTEILPTGNTIDEVVSSDAGDNQEITIQGYTISGGILTYAVNTVTLNGTTPVTLPTPLARAVRLSNDGSTDFAGTVTVYDTSNANRVHLTVTGSQNQSLKCISATGDKEFGFITHLVFSVERGSAGLVDFEIQVKPQGGVWKTQYYITVSSGVGSVVDTLLKPIIVPKNHDIKVKATASQNNTSVSARIAGYVAKESGY